jgi:hypothetical protein
LPLILSSKQLTIFPNQRVITSMTIACRKTSFK